MVEVGSQMPTAQLVTFYVGEITIVDITATWDESMPKGLESM